MAEKSDGADGPGKAATAEALKQEENRTFLSLLNESEVSTDTVDRTIIPTLLNKLSVYYCKFL